MAQFIDTNHANDRFRNAMDSHIETKKRVAEIKEKNTSGLVTKEEIEWLCKQVINGVDQMESSWYDD